jgi:hypothetical protein
VIAAGPLSADDGPGSSQRQNERKAANMFVTELRERFSRFGMGLRARLISFE